MNWIFTSTIGLAVLALLAIFVLKAKHHDAGSVHGHFDFDGYKAGELNRRGLIDRTKWH